MEKREIIYNGESVKIYGTEDPAQVIICFTDNITAYNKIKRAVIRDMGWLNCSIASLFFTILEKNGVPTHFIRQISPTEMLCRRVEVIPVEIIIRNVIAGSMSQRLGLKEGIRPGNTIYDLCLDNDDMTDSLINDHHAVALGLATYDELKTIYGICARINDVTKPLLAGVGLEMVDCKIQFGRTSDGRIVLADEITPDSSRFWDTATGEKLDKDRFRRDLGKVGTAYREVYDRLCRAAEPLIGKEE